MDMFTGGSSLEAITNKQRMGSSSPVHRVLSRKRSKQSPSNSTGSRQETPHGNRMQLETILNNPDTRSADHQKKRFRGQSSSQPVTGTSPAVMDRSHRMKIGFLLNSEEKQVSRVRSCRSGSRPQRSRSGERIDVRSSRSVEDRSNSRSPRREQRVAHFRCPCSALFSSSEELVIHRKQKHNNKSMFCPYCPSVYSRYDTVRNHVQEKHKKPGERWCHKCNYVTTSRSSFDGHMAQMHHVCHKCGKVYTRHLREHTQGCQATTRE